MKTEETYRKHYDKICRVQLAEVWLRAKRGLLRAALLLSFAGFATYGAPATALGIFAGATFAVSGDHVSAWQMLATVPTAHWAHSAAWVASAAGWTWLHRRQRYLDAALEAWKRTGDRQRARLEKGELWDQASYDATLADLGLVRYAQILLGASLSVSRAAARSTGAALEERGAEIERELAERARCLGIDPA